MELSSILNSNVINYIQGDIKITDDNILITKKNFSNYENLKTYFMQMAPIEKINKALLMLQLDQGVIEKPISELSMSSLNKLSIVEALLSNKKIIVFEQIDKSLNGKEKDNIKKIIKKLSEHNKIIALNNVDVDFAINFVKKIIIVDNNNIIKEFENVDWFNNSLYNYIDKPQIIDFYDYCQSKGIKLDNYTEITDLIKTVYRSV